MMNTSPPPPVLPGSLFADRYEVLEELGVGGMGAVYRVNDTLLGEVVALKVSVEAALDPQSPAGAVQRSEVLLARRVTHPNVARVFDLGQHDGHLYITMELVPGTSLRDRLVDGPLSLTDAVVVAHQVSSALVAAHDAGVLHLDLKPGNVVIVDGPVPRAVLIDFGIARWLGTRSDGFGTLDYMAPEQLEADALTGAADVYALGVVMYKSLSGRWPFPGHTREQRRQARLQHDPLPLDDGTPASLVGLVTACLAWAPADRPDARTVEGVLSSLRAGRSTEPGARAGAPNAPTARTADVGLLPGGLARRLAGARRRLLTTLREHEALQEVEAVLAVAPDLDVALALRALALVRWWNRTGVGRLAEAAGLAERATDAVATAVARAPHLADTHLADALIADYSGDTPYAVRALHRALGCDPMHAFSHEVLGRIELEGGIASGADRLLLAHDLDGAQVAGLAVVARDYFFTGRVDEARELLSAIDAIRPNGNEALSLRVRMCQWSHDVEAAQALRAGIAEDQVPVRILFRAVLDVVVGAVDHSELHGHLAGLIGSATSPKRCSYLHQLAAESFAAVEPERALQHVVTAAQLPLSDLRWLDACPALSMIRGESAFRAARAVVQHRLDLSFGAASIDSEATTAVVPRHGIGPTD